MLNPNLSHGKQICSRCIFDESTPEITFDEDGVCRYCHQVDKLLEEYGTGRKEGEERLAKIVQEIKASGKNKKYDCIVGVSGGTDSSYMLHWAKKVGLRPLAVHYDNTWNSEIATMNIARITNALDIDLYTHVVDNKEIDNIYRAFLKAAVPAIDVVTDLGFTQVLYKVARKYGVVSILEGHSFVEEGVSPVGNSYFDGKYIEDVCKEDGINKFATYPNMNFFDFMKWTIFFRIKKYRPYWYMDYSKAAAIDKLTALYGWKYYGGHHLENRITAFSHSFHNPQKFGMDQRNNSLCALVRNGSLARSDALEIYNEGPKFDNDLVEYTIKRLGFSQPEFESIMAAPNKTWEDFKSYKKLFEFFRPMFFLLATANLVPMSFYLKYCFPLKAEK